jgi:hypothetical protein
MHTSPFTKSHHHGGFGPGGDVWIRFIAKFFAAALIALTLLPFTAPFPACDLGNPWSTDSPVSDHSSQTNVLTDGACLHALPSSNPAPRIRAVVGGVLKRHSGRPPEASPRLTGHRRSPDLRSPADTLSAFRI